MPQPWLPGAERIACTRAGGSYDGTPFCFCIHTVEGDPSSIGACKRLAETHTSPPQLWYSPKLDWLAQGIPLNRSGYALAHPPGAPETNKAGAIQVELFGFAHETPDWPTEWLDRIGTRILRPIIDAGYPIDLNQIAPTTGNDGYGRNGAVRFSRQVWATFPGVCCHSNVAANDHWDAGAIDLTRIVAAARGTVTPTPPPPLEETEMAAPAVCTDTRGRPWVFFKGADNACWARCGTDPPFSLGGEVTDAITVIAGPDATIDVYAYVPDGNLWSIHADGTGWGAWYPVAA